MGTGFRAPRVQRRRQTQRGPHGLGKQCPVCAHRPPQPSRFDLERVQTRRYEPLTFTGYQGSAFPPFPRRVPAPNVLCRPRAPHPVCSSGDLAKALPWGAAEPDTKPGQPSAWARAKTIRSVLKSVFSRKSLLWATPPILLCHIPPPVFLVARLAFSPVCMSVPVRSHSPVCCAGLVCKHAHQDTRLLKSRPASPGNVNALWGPRHCHGRGEPGACGCQRLADAPLVLKSVF